jgi:hypothetical protein
MDTFFAGLGAPVMLLMGAFFGITALLWFLLPFSVFGIKARLDEQIELLRLIDRRLTALNQSRVEVRNEASEPEPAVSFESETAAEISRSADPAPTLSDSGKPAAPNRLPPEDRWQRPD